MFNILVVYPDILNYSGDLGNVVAIKKRLDESNIVYCIKNLCIGEDVNFCDYDFIYFPSGKNLEVKIVSNKLENHLISLKSAIENGISIICFGKTAKIFEKILDFEVCESQYSFDNVVVKTNIVGKPIKIVGVKKGNYKIVKSTTPFGRLFEKKEQYLEGVYYKNTLITSLHGPLLVKNPEVMDFLLTNALNNSKCGKLIGCDYNLERKARFRILADTRM